MSGRSVEENLQISLAQAVLIASSLQDFAIQIIAHVARGGVLDDAAFAAIRASCIRNLKNSEPSGLSVEDQSEIVRKALNDLGYLIDDAIRRGRQA